MSSTGRVIALLFVTLAAVAGVGYASVDSEYSVRASDTIELPDRTLTLQGTEYTVSSVGRVAAGDILEARTSGPDGAAFDVNLYSSDRRIVGGESGADGSVSFRTEGLHPGTYALVVYTADGSIAAPQPVVVAGYETTLDAPADLTAGESVDARVELNEIADIDGPERVELVVARNDAVVERVTMGETGANEYVAEVGSSLEPGEYALYATVRNETTVDGRREIVGVSDRTKLTVSEGGSESGSGPAREAEAGTDSGATSTDDPSNAPSNDASEAPSVTDTASPSAPADSATAAAVTAVSTSTEPATSAERSETATTAASEPATAWANDATPVTDTSGDRRTTGATMPDFALFGVALALVFAALLKRW